MKKFLSILLSVILIISICPMGLFSITASAASAEEITVDGIKYKIYNSAWASVVGYTSALPENVIIPSTINGYEVQSIEDNAFYNSRMESVFIPSSVDIIEEYAFADCYWLKDVTISYGVEAIWNSAFSETAISEIVIPGSVEYIERYAFSDCEDLHTVILQEGVEILESDVFSGCKRLETLCIPKSFRFADDDLNYVEDYDLTIYGYKNTYAEEVALMNGCLFKEIEVSSINISQEGLKTEYLVGTELDIKNINLYATYSFGKTYKVTDDFEVLGFNSTKLGSQSITVKYAGKQCHFNICVYSREEFAKSIKMDKLPSKTDYIQNEEKFDSRGGEIEITYKDGSKEKTPLTNSMITNFSNENSGIQNVIAKFGNCTCSFEVRILDAINKNVRITLNYLPLYTGNKIEPKPVVTVAGKTIIEGTDYTLEYNNNINAGNNAEILIKGKDYYSGINIKHIFSIGKADISNVNVSQIGQQYYTGRQIIPTPTMKFNDKTLVLGTDYNLQYENNIDIGEATVKIIGVGNYSGIKVITFKIVKYVATNETKTVGLRNGEINSLEIPKGTTVEGLVQKIQYSMFNCTFILDKITDLDTNSTENVFSKKYTLSNTNSVNKFVYTFNEPGVYVLTYVWNEVYMNYNNGIYTEVSTGISGRGGYGFIVPEEDLGTPANPDTPIQPDALIANPPIVQGIRSIYLDVETENPNEKITNIVWESSDESIAQVDDGKVILKKSGSVTISATVNNKTAKWILDLEKLDLEENGKILGYNPSDDKVTVTFKNELLIENTDYVVEKETKEDAVIIKVKGINMFDGEICLAFCKDNGNIYYCQHIYSNDYDEQCDFCYEKRILPYTLGDIDGVEGVTDADAEWLLMYTFFPEDYPVNQTCYFNGDGKVNDADAEHLLMFTFFPEDYPLH